VAAAACDPPSPAFPAGGKGASRPLSSGLPARKDMADNPLPSLARPTTACLATTRHGARDGSVAFHTNRRGPPCLGRLKAAGPPSGPRYGSDRPLRGDEFEAADAADGSRLDS
jgi:hypothetical protein